MSADKKPSIRGDGYMWGTVFKKLDYTANIPKTPPYGQRVLMHVASCPYARFIAISHCSQVLLGQSHLHFHLFLGRLMKKPFFTAASYNLA